MSATTWGVLDPTDKPLRGRCPACGQPFDDGCRLLQAFEINNSPDFERGYEVSCLNVSPEVDA